MNRTETVQIITLLAGNYDTIANKSDKQKELMLNTWYECLSDLEYKLVLHAVKKTIIESPYPPTIHDIRKNAIEIINPTTKVTAIEAWNEAYKMICSGSYMTEEQFKQASPIIQRFFTDVRQVRELAKSDINSVNTVTKGQFLKQYEVLVEREKEEKIIPLDMKNMISQITNEMEVKRLEGATYESKL